MKKRVPADTNASTFSGTQNRPLPAMGGASLQHWKPHTSAETASSPLFDVEIVEEENTGNSAPVLRVTFGGDWKIGAASREISADIRQNMESIHAALSIESDSSGQATPRRRRLFSKKAASPSLLTRVPVSALELVAEGLGDWDSSLLVLTTQLITCARQNDIPVRDARLPEGVRNLTALALAVPPNTSAQRGSSQTSTLEQLGGLALSIPITAGNIFNFLGETVLSFGRLFRGRSACTPANVWVCIQECGAEALPIVSLISLLVGLILAFVGVLQLSMFGAEIYVSSLVAVGMTRIMGAIMTGIILAGRTGAAYAAVIGTMQVNEEIDALTTLGVAPSDFLVMPRILAMIAMTPLLVLYSDFMGILGGFIVGVGILGLDPMEYYTFTQKGFGLNNLWVGIAHGVVFGFVIAITGCYQGLRCGRSAEAVGTATTSAVVFSIVGIVLSTAVLTILCNILKI